MSTKSNAEHRKRLVRNTEGALRKVTVKSEPILQTKEKSKAPCTKAGRKPVCPDFGQPNLNSVNRITQDILNLGDLKTCSASGLDKTAKLAINEKVSRRVNFPYDQPIYKDLIPLNVRSEVTTSVNVVRPPLAQKDIEPNLEDFLRPKTMPEYKFEVDVPRKQLNSVRDVNSLRLTKIISTWS